MIDWLAEINWYAVHAKPRREDLAARGLESLGFDVLLPKVRKNRFRRGVSIGTLRPLFPGYLFASFCPATALDIVRYARGVLNVVSSGCSPIPVEPEFIPSLRERLDCDDALPLEDRGWAPGTRVSIEQGPLQGLVGRVEREWDDHRRVAIFLEALHQARVLVDRQWLALAEVA